MLLTRRKYQVVLLEDNEIAKPFNIDFGRLNSDKPSGEYEYIYALQDMGDDILDLKVGESIYFQPNRDNASTKGIILRVI